MTRTSFIKTSVLGLTVAASSLYAEAVYSPHKYQQNDWFGEFGSNNTAMYVNPAGIALTDQLEVSAQVLWRIRLLAGLRIQLDALRCRGS